MEEPRGYKFKTREIVLIFLLLLVGGAVIFSLGIKVGQNVLPKNAVAPKEEVKLENTNEAAGNYEDNNLPEATKPEVKQEVAPEKEMPKEEQLGIQEITSEIKGKYTIQISSHQSEGEAKKAASALYKSGYKIAYYMEADLPGKGTWYRVGIGFFKQKSSAETFAEMLKKQGKITSYLIRKID